MNQFDLPEMSFESIMLQRMKVAAQGRLSAQLLHDAELQTVTDMMSDQLVVQLRSYVYAHKLEHREATYEISATATASYEPRRMVAPPAVAVLIATALGIASGSVWTVAVAGLFALAAIVTFAANPPQEVTKTEKGKVEIASDYFNSFPDNQTVYPKDLGDAVKLMIHTPPTFYRESDR